MASSASNSSIVNDHSGAQEASMEPEGKTTQPEGETTKETPEVHVLYTGYSYLDNKGAMRANCSCVLVKTSSSVIIIDTMTAWDSQKIVQGLASHGMTCDDVTHVVATHGHSDHLGNLNLFTSRSDVVHIVGYTVSSGDTFTLHPFECDEPYPICEGVTVVPTPGHTAEHVSVVVTAADGRVTAIAGDLFEKEGDIMDPKVWQDAGSELPAKQRLHRQRLAEMSSIIIPGHGPAFPVTDELRLELTRQLTEHC